MTPVGLYDPLATKRRFDLRPLRARRYHGRTTTHLLGLFDLPKAQGFLDMGTGRRTRGMLATGASIGVIAVLALSGCSANTGTGKQSGSGGGGIFAPEPPKITLGNAYAYPTDLEVPGLVGQRILSSTGSEARWSYLPGEQAFNPALGALVREYLDAQATTREMTYTPEAHTPSTTLLDRGCVPGSTSKTAREILDDTNLSLALDNQIQQTITCEPILAAGTTFGERIRIVRGNVSEVHADWVEVLYTDTATGETAKGKELFTDASLPQLLDALYENLKLEQPMSGGQVLPYTAEMLAQFKASLYNVGFNDNGDALVTVDGNLTSVIGNGDPSYQPKAETLVIPAERTSEFLSPLGQSISAAKAASEPWSGPAPVPFGDSYVDCDLVPCIAVTYDDGPSSATTPTVLDAYASSPYAATTFFVLGSLVQGNEALLQRAVQEGNLIGSHTWDHPELPRFDDATVTSQVEGTAQTIEEATGQPVYYMRPPYGSYDDRTRFLYSQPSILWTVDTNDWQFPGTEVVIQRSLDGASPDGIILMHDIHETTVAGAKRIVDGLLERGYSLVTIDQLFHNTPPPQGSYFWNAEDVRAGRPAR